MNFLSISFNHKDHKTIITTRPTTRKYILETQHLLSMNRYLYVLLSVVQVFCVYFEVTFITPSTPSNPHPQPSTLDLQAPRSTTSRPSTHNPLDPQQQQNIFYLIRCSPRSTDSGGGGNYPRIISTRLRDA